MTMNKVLLLLIVASGFLLIFYANTDLFRWKSKQIVDRPIAASVATRIHVIDAKGHVNSDDNHGADVDGNDRHRIIANNRIRTDVNNNNNIEQLYRRGHAMQSDNKSDKRRNKAKTLLNGDDGDDDSSSSETNNDVVIRSDDDIVQNDEPNVDFIRQNENWQRFDVHDEWPRRRQPPASISDFRSIRYRNDDNNVYVADDNNINNSMDDGDGDDDDDGDSTNIKRVKYVPRMNATEYNIFIIYTKQNYLLKMKFELFIKSLLKYSSIKLHLHVISDESSEPVAEKILKRLINQYKRIVFYTLYSVDDCAKKISDISRIMMPYFSSHSGSYYNDALFYLSLGLHRIVDVNMRRAILIDCDVVFRTDVKRLFDEFDKFSADNLFGLAPELTPVYRHILYQYRAKNAFTDFGTPYTDVQTPAHNSNHHRIGGSNIVKHGYPGLNSGVVLIDFDRIRKSKLYANLLDAVHVQRITSKYEFKGHLGDQDYYTLIGYEHPSLIYRMDCVWNRQLCTWWKEHGYSDIFDTFFRCDGHVHLYHGNCNSRVPE